MKSRNFSVRLRIARVVSGQLILVLLMLGAIPTFAAEQGKDSQHSQGARFLDSTVPPSASFPWSLGHYVLQGAWLLNFTVPPNGFLPEEFQLLVNFTVDGSVLATSNLPTLPITPIVPFRIREGTGHGEWARIRPGKFIVEVWRPSTCVDIGGCPIPFPPGLLSNGDFLGWARGKAEIELDGKTDTMQGVIELQLFGPDRQTPLAPPLPGTMTGERLRPHPIIP